MDVSSIRPAHETPSEQDVESRLQEVWDVIAELKDDKMAEASRTALEMHMRGEMPDEEYGAMCFHLGTRAGSSADHALDVLANQSYEGKPKEYWIALHDQLVTLSQTLEQRAWLIEKDLQAQGRTCLTKKPEGLTAPPEERAAQVISSIAIMRSGGTERQITQDDLLHKYGSEVDRDVSVRAPEAASEAFANLLNMVPGVTLTPEMVARLSDSRYTIIGERSAGTTLLTGQNKSTFVEAHVDYTGPQERGPRVNIIRFTDGKGAGVHLDFSPSGDFVGGAVYAQNADKADPQFRTTRPGEAPFDKEGHLYMEGGRRINIPGIVGSLLDPDTLGKSDDPVAGIDKIISYH